MKHEIPYVDGKLEGFVKLYWPNGQLKRLTFYKNHKRHGLEKLWNEAGVLVDEGIYYNGAPVGLHRRFYDNGNIKMRTFYFGPKHTQEKCYSPDGERL